MDIERLPDNSGLSMNQPYLIENIIDAVKIDLKMTNTRTIPAVGTLLTRDKYGPERKHNWKYITIIRMFGYLQGTSRPDISMATHQCARLNTNPKLCHERAVKRFCKYLLDTKDKGIILRPDKTKGV